MQVNLLKPQSTYLQAKSSKKFKVLPLTVGLIILVAFIAVLVLNTLNHRMEQSLAAMQQEVNKFTQVEQAYNQQQAYQHTYQELVQAQTQIKAASPQHGEYLDALTRVLPSGAKVTSMAVEGDPWQIKLTGFTESHQEVAQIGLQLHQEPLLSKSMINSSAQKDLGYQFQIIIQGGAAQ